MKHNRIIIQFITILFIFFGLINLAEAANFTSKATGNWSASGTWTLTSGTDADGIPDADDNATILTSHTVTVTVAAAVLNLTINSGGTLNLNQAITVNGTTSISGTLGVTSTTGAKTFVGAVTINSGGAWSNTSNEAVELRGGLTNNGTFTSGTDTYTFTTNDQTISGSMTFSNLTFNAARTFTIASGTTLTVTGTLTLTDGTVNTGTIIAQGNITLNQNFDGGTTSLNITGGNNQTLTGGGSATAGDFLLVTINKTGGTLTLASTIRTGRDWTNSTPARVTPGTSTLVFALRDLTITGTETYNNVTFYGNDSSIFTIASGTTLTVTGTLTLTDGTVNGGAITAQGNITLASTFDGGTAALNITGTANQTLTGGGSGTEGDFLPLTIDKTNRTLTLASTIRTGRDWTNSTPARVTPGTSTLVFALRNLTITGTETYNNVTFYGNDSSIFTIASGTTLTVTGTLTLTDGTVNTGTIIAQGNITLASTFDGGTAALTITGTANQTLTGGGSGTEGDFLPLTIDKTNRTLTLASTIRTGRNWTWSRGTVNAGTSTVVFAIRDLTITGSMSFNNLTFDSGATFTVTSGTTLTVTGILTLSGSDGSLVTLRSSITGTQWHLTVNAAATCTANYVDVQDSDASAGKVITAYDSLDSDNNLNWIFPANRLIFTSTVQEIVQGSPSSQISIQVQDSGGNPKVLTADVQISLTSTSSSGFFSLNSTPWSDITSVTIPAGSSTASFFYKDSAVGSPVIRVDETSDKGWTYAEQTETITSAVNNFAVTASTPQVAGSSFTLTITAKDEKGQPSDSFSGTVNLSVNYVSPASGSGTLSVTSTSDFINGIATITNQSFSDCGTITITATKSDDATKTGTSSNILFIPYDFIVVPDATIQTVNKAFNLTVTARNAQGTTCPNYKGTANLSVVYVSPSLSQSGSLSPSSLGSTNFTNGIATITTTTYNKWGRIKIKAAEALDANRYGQSQEITFNPKDFLITLSSPPLSRNFYYKDEQFTATVTARDQDNNTITNYQGTVELASSDRSTAITYTFLSLDSGTHNFTASFSQGGKRTFSVKDTTYTTITGTSTEFEVKEGKIKVVSTSGPVGKVAVRVEILDSEDKIISEDDSTTFTVTLIEGTANNSATSDTTEVPVTIQGGAATIYISDVEAETVTVTPAASPVLTPVAGTVTFGSFRGRGIGIDMWREIK